jgi:RHS repeat-associated protein
MKTKYSWLGGEQQSTEFASGVSASGARSYVPQLGRFLQPDPIPGGSASAYTYTFGDPVNSSDPSGELTYGVSGWLKAQDNQEAKEVAEREVARETLEREEAERRAREAQEAAEAAAAAAAAAATPAEAAEQEPLGGYAGWACEYAVETGQYDPECGGRSGSGRFIEYGAAGHGNPAPKGGKGGSSNEGSACGKRSGCGGGGGSRSACVWVAGSAGGLVGTAAGGVWGGLVGAWVGSLVCG